MNPRMGYALLQTAWHSKLKTMAIRDRKEIPHMEPLSQSVNLPFSARQDK